MALPWCDLPGWLSLFDERPRGSGGPAPSAVAPRCSAPATPGPIPGVRQRQEPRLDHLRGCETGSWCGGEPLSRVDVQHGQDPKR